MNTYRLFIAVELPEAVKDALSGVQRRLQADHFPVKWVAPGAMHLTLRFLGETDAALVGPLGDALQAALGGLPAPLLHVTRAGAFPGLARPSVLWVGVGGDLEALSRAGAALGRELDALGLPPADKPFAPHLTIGRVRRDADRAAQARLGERVRALQPVEAPPWRAEHVTLFRSDLRPAGPVYQPVATCRLQIA